jgi:hypothetical protein
MNITIADIFYVLGCVFFALASIHLAQIIF